MIRDPVQLLPPLPKNYTREDALRDLEDLYAQVPALLCRGLCHDSCTVVAASELERQRIAEAGATIDLTVEQVEELLDAGKVPCCPALGPMKNCTVYKIRPFTCRAYGTVRDLRCGHGCVPERFLTTDEAMLLNAKIEQLSRYVTGVRAWPIQRPR